MAHNEDTSAEQIDRFGSDEMYQAKLADQRARVEALAAACALDEHQLVTELRDLGVKVTSVWDLVATGGAPPAAVPVLVSHLTKDHHERIWQGIVRALSVRYARVHAFSVLTRLYRAEDDPHRRRLLASAIGSMARPADVQDLPDIEKYHALFRESDSVDHPGPDL